MKRTINDYIPEETLCRLTEEAFEAPAAEGRPAACFSSRASCQEGRRKRPPGSWPWPPVWPSW